MDTNEIRALVNKDVNPPVKGKPMTLTKELSGEIARTAPFWAPLLRNRDIRSADGGDEYVTGLIETFARIFSIMKERGVQAYLSNIELDTFYNLDAELQKDDMGLSDEYPALEMADVKSMGPFGAGILMAYALFETALAVQGPAPTTAPPRVAEKEVFDAGVSQSLMDDLTAGLPENETSNPEPNPVPAQKSVMMAWSEANQKAMRPVVTTPLMLVGIYPTPNGVMVKGELPLTLSGVAQAYNIVKTIFGLDANISMGPNGLEFSFAYVQEGGKP